MTYAIIGARGKVTDPEAMIQAAREWAAHYRSEILLADADVVFGRDHLESAVSHALRAQTAGTMVSRSVAMESLRYLAAQRQVADAIRVAGIRRGTNRIAVVLFGATTVDSLLALQGWQRDDSVLEARGKSLDVLGITKEEAATVPPDRRQDLALEKVALLDVAK
jgi:KEOPS complex subunit Cgi121